MATGISFAILRSVYVLLAFVSDNFQLLDLWIITPPGSPPVPGGRTKHTWRTRAGMVLKTACTYAVVEPLWFRLINGAPAFWIWFFAFMSCTVQINALMTAQFWVVGSVKSAIEKHRQCCATSNAPFEKSDTGPEQVENKGDLVPHALREAKANDTASARCPCKYEAATAAKLAPLLPAIAAAGTNVGIRLYAAYLHSDDSKTWFENFAVGWCVITLMELLLLACSKYFNTMVSSLFNRHVMVVDQHWTLDLVMRVSAWVTLMCIRAVCRAVQGQSMFTTVVLGKDGLALSPVTLRAISTPPGIPTMLVAEGKWWEAYQPWASIAMGIIGGWLGGVGHGMMRNELDQQLSDVELASRPQDDGQLRSDTSTEDLDRA